MATSLEINRKTIMRVDNQTSGFLLTVIIATLLPFVNTILPQISILGRLILSYHLKGIEK
jgi:hypothetical protein